MVVIMGCIQLGLIYGLTALGIFISFRILNMPDLSVDGTFPFGTAVSAAVASLGFPVLGIAASFVAGVLAGIVTGLLNVKLKIQPILAGILTMTALYSITIRVMGNTSNLPVTRENDTFSRLAGLIGSEDVAKTAIPLVIAVGVILILNSFFKTQLGLSLRATGDNEDMVRSSSIYSDFIKVFGLALSNGLVGLSGGILAQYQGFSDVNLGTGILVMGLACLIIGEVIFGKRTILIRLTAIVLGAIAYRFIISIVLQIGLSANDMKLISAILIAVAISFPTVREKIGFSIKKKKRCAKC